MNLNWGGGYTKSEVDALLNGKSDTSHTHTKSQITDFPSYGSTAGTICEGNDSRLSDARTPTSHTHVKSEITDFPTLSTVATSGSYNDLSNKPTIPTVNNATLKIQKNGTDVKTFTANASSDVTCNITVPTKTSDLTNDSGFLTSHQSLSNYSILANTVKSLSISGKTITVTPGSGDAYTLTTQDTTYTHPTSSGNKHIPSGGSSGQFLGWSADGTAKWVNNPNTNTWTAMVGATSSSNGSVGYVNAVPPKDGYNTKYLRADGTWQVPPDHTYTVNNATLTIQQNGTTVDTFTANSSSDKTVNIQCVDLTNNQTVGGIKTFSNAPVVNSISLNGKTIDTDANGGMTYNGRIVDTIEEHGYGYIRYSNGLQICWGTGAVSFNNSTQGDSTFTYPKAFISSPAINITGQGGNLAFIFEAIVISYTSACNIIARLNSVQTAERYFFYTAIGEWK